MKQFNQILKNTHAVSKQAVSWPSRVKPKLTVYDKLLCRNKNSLTVVGEPGKIWSFHSLPLPSNHSHCHETNIAIPIPIKIPRDSWEPWEFPI